MRIFFALCLGVFVVDLDSTLSPSAGALTVLCDVTCIAESLQLVESITHKWLKTESEKPTPTTPTELQPAVHTLWRCSTIRKNLLGVAIAPPATTHTPTTTKSPTQTQTDPAASEAAILRSLGAVPVGKLVDLVSRRMDQEIKSEIKAIKAREANAAAESQTTPPRASQCVPQPVSQTPSHHAQQPAPLAASQSAPPFASESAPAPSNPTSLHALDRRSDKNSPEPSHAQTPASPEANFSNTPRAANSSLPPKFRYPPPKRTRV